MKTLSLTTKEIVAVEKPLNTDEILQALTVVSAPVIDSPVKPLNTCTDCAEGSECADCIETAVETPVMTPKSDTAYNFNLVVPTNNSDTPTESDTDRRRRLIYIGVGLIAVFIFVFIALRSTKKTA